jgi:dephospho-CoA kinase
VIVLGLTGGIGSGKSALAARLATHAGVRVVFADDVAKEAMSTDAALRAALAARFGPETFGPDGVLDRAGLAARVFGDPAELAALNALVHPAVRRAMQAEIAAARADGVRLLVYEAALLFEAGADALVDHVALVAAPEEVRLRRAMARDGATADEVRARMARQMDPAEAVARTRARGGTVVDNSEGDGAPHAGEGGLTDLHAQADALVRALAPDGDAGAG